MVCKITTEVKIINKFYCAMAEDTSGSWESVTFLSCQIFQEEISHWVEALLFKITTIIMCLSNLEPIRIWFIDIP